MRNIFYVSYATQHETNRQDAKSILLCVLGDASRLGRANPPAALARLGGLLTNTKFTKNPIKY
jgi:hypothetical protein